MTPARRPVMSGDAAEDMVETNTSYIPTRKDLAIAALLGALIALVGADVTIGPAHGVAPKTYTLLVERSAAPTDKGAGSSDDDDLSDGQPCLEGGSSSNDSSGCPHEMMPDASPDPGEVIGI